ncbi:MAG: VanZ family protein [Lachnospiraceae bacterium]|nr:VanZ family protein [Lachnospiraceae bacterium]
MQKNRESSNIFTKVLFALYLILLTWIILFKLSLSPWDLGHFRSLNLIPFGATLQINGRLGLYEIVYNVLFFVPVGIFLCMLWPEMGAWKKIFLAAGLSLLYEVLQYVLAIGASDVTDLIDNTLGGALGVLIFLGLHRLLKERTNLVINVLAAICIVVVFGFVIFIQIVNY